MIWYVFVVVYSSDTISWVMVCLSTLASNPVSLTSQPACAELWRRVWLSSMKWVCHCPLLVCIVLTRTLSVHTAEPEGYHLLTQLLELELVSCDMEPWKLLNTTFNLPMRSPTHYSGWYSLLFSIGQWCVCWQQYCSTILSLTSPYLSPV